MNRIIAQTKTIHPIMIGGLIVGTGFGYYAHFFEWHYNKLDKKPLPCTEYFKKHFKGIALSGAIGFTIGGTLGSFALLAKQSGAKRNIIAALLSIGFCVVMRTIDIMI